MLYISYCLTISAIQQVIAIIYINTFIKIIQIIKILVNKRNTIKNILWISTICTIIRMIQIKSIVLKNKFVY